MATSRVFPAWSLARARPTADASSSSGRRRRGRPSTIAPSSASWRRAVVASAADPTADGSSASGSSASGSSASDATSSARAKSDAELVDARIRAERMAVRLKLQSAAAGKSPLPAAKSASSAPASSGSGARPSLDAAIARERAVSRDAGRSSPTIDAERAAVRTRLNKFSMNRYAFVANGANAGRVVDRLTGEIAPTADDAASAIEDRVDLARERVKQAQQELQDAVAAADAKRADLDARVASLERLGEELARERKERAEEDADASRAEERRAVRAQLDAMTDPANAAQTKGAGAGAKKSATATTTTTVGFEPATSSATSSASSESSSDAKSRAEEAIRSRASSSLSRLRKQRRIKRAGAARRNTSASMTNSAAVPAEESTAGSLDDPLFEAAAAAAAVAAARDEDDVVGSNPAADVLPKPIFVLSDCTGESAANTCRAALSQFAELMNLSAPTNLYIFRFLSEGGDAYKICRQAAEDDALVVYTLSDADMATAVETACKLYGVKSVNLWGPLLAAMEDHLAMRTTGVPMSEAAARRRHSSSETLSTDYYRMIEAVEFTRQMDDGARPDRWKEADILILGVSRTGKTPLSIYLGQRGYKVANLPLVPRDGRLMVPEYVRDVDDARVFCLLIDGEVLHSIRANRLSTIGVRSEDKSAREYATMRQVTQELSLAKALYARHPGWTVLDVTHKGVEETAARIMKIMFTNENANNFEVMKAT